MEPEKQLSAEDLKLVDKIVGQLKSQGIFDQFRKECMADVDTKVISPHLNFYKCIFKRKQIGTSCES